MRRRDLPLLVAAFVLVAMAGLRLEAEAKPQAPPQGGGAAKSPRVQRLEKLAAEPVRADEPPAAVEASTAPSSAARPEGAPPPFDRATTERQLAAWRAYYDYRISGLHHRAEVYGWQLVSSEVTFAMVIFLVLVGVYFSWLQFRLSLRPRPAPGPDGKAPPAEATVAAAVTEISASLEGVKVSSPVLGVIILTLSLLFFYLYLAYVYPIHQSF